MTPQSDFFALFNPSSGRGTGARRVGAYLSLLRERLGPVDHALTAHAGHEARLVDEALQAGYSTIIAVGGDGTWGAAADRIVRSGRDDVALALLPAGTGNDFGKSLGIRAGRVEGTVDAIAARRTRRIDVGRVGDRYFLNVVGMGFDIAVIDDAETTPLLKGDLLYRFCAIRQLFRFPGIHLDLRDGSGAGEKRRYLMLVISNGNYFGGSFHIAPDASLEDGRLDAVSIYDAGPLERARLFSRVSRGEHPAEAKVEIRQDSRFRVAFDGPSIRYEVDGDVFTHEGGELAVESIPSALTIYTP
jgi:YegS/Rv2252/BmrU family lipid kinase